jgi:hypothetical protein
MIDARCMMRTTLVLDDDILAAAKELAYTQGKTAGEVISSLARKALLPTSSPTRTRSGVPLLPLRPDATLVTTELVLRLIEESE